LFIKGLAGGLLATGLNFAIMYLGMRWLLERQSGAARALVPVTYVLRYLIFGALVILFLRFRLGSIPGFLVGMTAGIAGFLVWQGINAHKRSNRVSP